MGLKPLRIYLDSCLVIYLIEEYPTFAPTQQAKMLGLTAGKQFGVASQ